MSLFTCSLNSGSNANCYYIGNQDDAILIDGGLSCRETVKRMKRLGLSIKKVRGIFVSHEHGDHVHGIPGLSKKFQLPVYITPDTLRSGRLDIRDEFVIPLYPYRPVNVGDLVVTAFPKLHDACDPLSFTVADSTVTVGIFTDIGAPCANLIHHFKQCHAAFLEANYDDDMLSRGSYPVHLKNRIRGGLGHLSNDQAMELFLAHRPPFMSHLFLAHLSRENNSPKLVKNSFARIAAGTEIVIASRDKESALYHIRGHGRRIMPVPERSRVARQSQLSLF